MKFASAAIVSVVTGNIVLNERKLTDFTTNWHFQTTDVGMYNPEFRHYLIQSDYKGKLQVDVMGEKLKWTASGDETWNARHFSPGQHMPPPSPLLPLHAHDSGMEVIIDGPSGQATVVDKGKLDFGPGGAFKVDGGVCFHVQIPVHMVPPGSILKSHVDREFKGMEHAANNLPHKTLANGNIEYSHEAEYPKIHHYPHRAVSFIMEPDGTPVKFNTEVVCDEECLSQGPGGPPKSKITMSFDSFTEGAGDVTAHSCGASSVLELAGMSDELQQRFWHVAEVFDLQMEQFAENAGVSVPSLKSALQQQQLLAQQSQNQGVQQTWKVGLLAGVAGMAGGAVVLALDKVFRRRETPLLSEA